MTLLAFIGVEGCDFPGEATALTADRLSVEAVGISTALVTGVELMIFDDALEVAIEGDIGVARAASRRGEGRG